MWGASAVDCAHAVASQAVAPPSPHAQCNTHAGHALQDIQSTLAAGPAAPAGPARPLQQPSPWQLPTPAPHGALNAPPQPRAAPPAPAPSRTPQPEESAAPALVAHLQLTPGAAQPPADQLSPPAQLLLVRSLAAELATLATIAQSADLRPSELRSLQQLLVSEAMGQLQGLQPAPDVPGDGGATDAALSQALLSCPRSATPPGLGGSGPGAPPPRSFRRHLPWQPPVAATAAPQPIPATTRSSSGGSSLPWGAPSAFALHLRASAASSVLVGSPVGSAYGSHATGSRLGEVPSLGLSTQGSYGAASAAGGRQALGVSAQGSFGAAAAAGGRQAAGASRLAVMSGAQAVAAPAAGARPAGACLLATEQGVGDASRAPHVGQAPPAAWRQQGEACGGMATPPAIAAGESALPAALAGLAQLGEADVAGMTTHELRELLRLSTATSLAADAEGGDALMWRAGEPVTPPPAARMEGQHQGAGGLLGEPPCALAASQQGSSRGAAGSLLGGAQEGRLRGSGSPATQSPGKPAPPAGAACAAGSHCTAWQRCSMCAA